MDEPSANAGLHGQCIVAIVGSIVIVVRSTICYPQYAGLLRDQVQGAAPAGVEPAATVGP